MRRLEIAGSRPPAARFGCSGWHCSALTAAALAMAVLTASGVSHAQPTTVPSTLTPCEQYRLAFVTSTTRTAFSTDIAGYNIFVSSAANSVPELAALGTTWTAIASTSTVAAHDNTGTNPLTANGVPIYRLDDILVASDNADLWAPPTAANIDVAEDASTVVASVWSGTDQDGGIAGDSLGGPVIGVAKFGSTTSNLITDDWISAGVQNLGFSFPLYAMSDVLTVSPGATDLCLRVVYGAESIVTGPLSFGHTALPQNVSATIRLSGFEQAEDVVAGLGDLAAFSLDFGDGTWTDLTSFSLLTDATGEVTTLSYATTTITTPSVVDGRVLNSSFSLTVEGTDIASGLGLEYFYASSAQTIVVPPAPELPALSPFGLGIVAGCLALAAFASLGRRLGR